MKKTYNVYWMVGKNINNFGDILTPYILDYYNISYQYTEKENCNLIGVGSIANWAPDHCIVLGSGIAYQKISLNKTAQWKFVRGPITRENVIRSGGICPEIYGDAGMLINKFWKESIKKHDIGFIPHMKEYNLIKEKYPNEYVINLNNPDPQQVAGQITSCRNIISSSLHGIIGAHAYEIPAARIKFTKDIIKGDDTKYKDHYASLNLDHKISTLDSLHFTTPSNVDFSLIEDIFKAL